MSNCILFIIWSALLIASVSANFPTVIIKSCVKDSKVKSLDVALLYGNDHATATQPAKCYMTCLYESIGLIVDNKVNTDLLSAARDGAMASSPLMKLIESCKDIEALAECDIGYLLFECIRKNGKMALIKHPSEESKVE